MLGSIDIKGKLKRRPCTMPNLRASDARREWQFREQK